MKLTKITLISFLLLAVLTLGAVSAADDNATSEDLASEIAIDENLQVDETNLHDDLQETQTNENLEISANETGVGVGEKTFSDIQDMIDQAYDGDVINISGTYVGDGSPITTGGNDISFTVQGKDDATLDARGLSGFIQADSSSVTFKNIRFINSKDCAVSGDDITTFVNCTFINCTSSSVSDDIFSNIVASDCKFIDCSSSGTTFWFSTLFECEVINCNATESSIMYDGEATNCIFKNCLVRADEICHETTLTNCNFPDSRENVNFEAERMVKEVIVNYTGKGWINEEIILYVYLPYDVSGTLVTQTDEDDEETYEFVSSDLDYPYITSFTFKKPNKAHWISYSFSSDTGEYDVEGKFNFAATKNYCINIGAEDLVYGGEGSVTVRFPEYIKDGTGAIYLNGVLYRELDFSEDDTDASFTIYKLDMSQLSVNAVYRGDGSSGFVRKEVTKTFDILPQIIAPTVSFKERPKVIVNYAKTNDCIILVDNDGNILFNSSLSNGQVIWELDELEYASETYYGVLFGGSEMGFELEAGPVITLPQKMWVGDNHNFTAEFPDGILGWQMKIDVDEIILFDGILSSTVLNLTLPDLQAGEYDITFSAEFDDGTDWGENQYTYNIKLFNSNQDFEMDVNFPSVVAKGNSFEVTVTLPDEVSGSITLLIDGNAVETRKCDYEVTFNIDNSYGKGNHTYSVTFAGDDYFYPKSVNGTFSVEDYAIYLPENVIINDDEDSVEGYVKFDSKLKGTLQVNVNGNKYDVFDLDDDNEITLHLEEMFYEGEISLGSNTILLLYKDKKGNQVFKNYYKVFVDYTLRFDVEDEFENFTYGAENIVKLILPDDAKSSKLTILVNGAAHTNWRASGSTILINVTDCIGEFTVTARYNGDSLFTHPVEVNKTFFSKPGINYQESIAYKDSDDAISLRLPGDANGKLVVTVDGNQYAAVDLIDGYAGVKFTDLTVGDHEITANYTGTDYPVEAVDFDVEIEGRIIIEGLDEGDCVKYGKSFKVYLYLPTDARGTLIVNVGYEYYEEDLVDGYAEIIVNSAEVGVGEFDVDAYFESYYYEDEDHYYSVDSLEYTIKIGPKFTIAKNMVVFGTNYITINTYDDSIGGVFKVLCDDNGEAFEKAFSKELVDGVAKISLSSLTAGEHKLLLIFEGDDGFEYSEGATVNINKAAKAKVVVYSLGMLYQDGSKFKARVFGTDGKPLKNALVTIFINNKKVKSVRTNANGWAYYTVPNLPGKYNVHVVYGAVKSAATKITVNQILVLKAVSVKKSAKNLVLTATLKKVNGKYLKNKLITFKFNGIVKKARTNAKGIAKVTYAKGNFNKLAVGKKVYYQATYVKTTVKRIATVKK